MVNINKDMICINDIYFDENEDIKKLALYVCELERKSNFYEKGYKKVLKLNDELNIKIRRLRKINHIYKVEMNRCVRKLSRIYNQLHLDIFLTNTLGLTNTNPDDFVGRYKNV